MDADAVTGLSNEMPTLSIEKRAIQFAIWKYINILDPCRNTIVLLFSLIKYLIISCHLKVSLLWQHMTRPWCMFHTAKCTTGRKQSRVGADMCTCCSCLHHMWECTSSREAATDGLRRTSWHNFTTHRVYKSCMLSHPCGLFPDICSFRQMLALCWYICTVCLSKCTRIEYASSICSMYYSTKSKVGKQPGVLFSA